MSNQQERENKPITVEFTGMSVELGVNVPLTVNLRELHHLLEIGDIEVRAKRIRPCLIQSLAEMYNPTPPERPENPLTPGLS